MFDDSTYFSQLLSTLYHSHRFGKTYLIRYKPEQGYFPCWLTFFDNSPTTDRQNPATAGKCQIFYCVIFILITGKKISARTATSVAVLKLYFGIDAKDV